MRNSILLVAVAALAACSTTQSMPDTAASQIATAALVRADGSSAGTAILSERKEGLWLDVSADGPSAGSFGMHVHAVGRCDGPEFTTAGPHWNPASKQHGLQNPMGTHAGDLPNVTASAQGKIMAEAPLTGAALAGEGGLFDGDGASIIIHEKADDYRTDPSGNSGKRIICGVFRRE